MIRAFIAVIACITLIAFAGACSSGGKSQDKTGKQKKAQVEKTAQKTAQKTVQHKQIKGRKRYEAFASARIRDAENRLEDMKSRAMHSSGNSKRRAERNIRDMQNCIHEANVNLNSLEKANASDWEKSKQDMESSLAKLSRYTD